MFTATLVAATLALLPDGGEQHRCTLSATLRDGTAIELSMPDCHAAERAELAAAFAWNLDEFCVLFTLLGATDDITIDRQTVHTSFGY